MSRIQLALNVDDLHAAIAFYTKLFDTEPAKVKPGYANFALTEPPLKLVRRTQATAARSIISAFESSDKVHQEIARLAGEGMFTQEEIGTTCCFATQDKVWVTGPAGERWEVDTVLADSETLGTIPELVGDPTGGCACASDTTTGEAAPDNAPSTTACC